MILSGITVSSISAILWLGTLWLATIDTSQTAGTELHSPSRSVLQSSSRGNAKSKTCHRAGDQIWLISCRGLPCPDRSGSNSAHDLVAGLKYWRYNRQESSWDKSTRQNLLDGDFRKLRNVVWVHGDHMGACEAFETGRQIYQELVRSVENPEPIRFIIWSWPSAKTLSRPVQDARLKAARIPAAAVRLAGLLETIPANSRVSLIGFSFGVRVISATLQLLAGGDLDDYKLHEALANKREKYRVAFFASAIDSGALQPGRRFGKAIGEMKSLLLLNNYCDWVLKRYGKLYCRCARRGPQALGYTGLATNGGLSADRDRIEQYNASAFVGRHHAWRPYVYTPQLMSLIREETLGEK